MEQKTYDIVLDQGGNIGIHCFVCNQARWDKDHDTLDWSTQQPCPNCIKLKADGVYVVEANRYYTDTISDLTESVKTHKKELAEKIKNKSDKEGKVNEVEEFELEQKVKRQREKVEKTEDRLKLLKKAEIIVKDRLSK